MLTVILYRDAQKQHRWRIRSANGRILADSGEGYKSAQGRDHGLEVLLAELRNGSYVTKTGEAAVVAHPCH